METAGDRLLAADLVPLMDHPRVIGLAEFMNFPGVIHRDPGCMAKLRAFAGGHIDGHAPLLSGRDLNAYISAGIRTGHEATTAEEALEKLRHGLRVLIREGSVSKDLHALIPILTERHAPFLAFCTDDRNPPDIAEHGHLEYMIRTAIALGAPPLAVYCAASLSAAEAFGLKDRGLIAPGKRADIAVIDTLDRRAQLGCDTGRAVPATGLPAPAGDPASEDHRPWHDGSGPVRGDRALAYCCGSNALPLSAAVNRRARTGQGTLRGSVARSVARRRKPQGKGLSARPVG
jgi:adenine deaminase